MYVYFGRYSLDRTNISYCTHWSQKSEWMRNGDDGRIIKCKDYVFPVSTKGRRYLVLYVTHLYLCQSMYETYLTQHKAQLHIT